MTEKWFRGPQNNCPYDKNVDLIKQLHTLTLWKFVGSIGPLNLLAFFANTCGDGRLILPFLLLVFILVTAAGARLLLTLSRKEYKT